MNYCGDAASSEARAWDSHIHAIHTNIGFIFVVFLYRFLTRAAPIAVAAAAATAAAPIPPALGDTNKH